MASSREAARGDQPAVPESGYNPWLQPADDGVLKGDDSDSLIGLYPSTRQHPSSTPLNFDIVVRQAYIDRLGLTGAALMVYSLIASAPAQPSPLSQPYIAYRCGISRRHVKTILDDLRGRGLIACDRPGGADGPARWRATDVL